MTPAARILVNATSGVGENLLAVPFLRELSRRFPEARVTVAVRFELARELLERTAPLHRVLVLNAREYGTPGRLVELVGELRASHFDWCFNLIPANKLVKNLLALVSGARSIVGHEYAHRRLGSAAFLVDRQVPLLPAGHDVEQNLALLDAVRPAASEPIDLSVRFPVTDAERSRARQWVLEHVPTGRPIVGVHPGSSLELGMEAKRWPPERFAELIGELGREPGMAPVIFGGPDEAALAGELARSTGGVACTGQPLGTLAALLASCRLVVSNDSFPMHLAAAVGAPVVALFGPTDPARTRPWTTACRVVRLGMECSPCWSLGTIGRPFRCTNPERFACVRDLDVGRALAACRELLRETGGPDFPQRPGERDHSGGGP